MGARGAKSQQAYDVVLTSMRRNDVASTSFRLHVPTRFLINQCQIITFLILKSDNIENSRLDLKGIILQVPSNQITVAFIIILPFNLGGEQRVCCPPLKLLGAFPAPPTLTPLFLRLCNVETTPYPRWCNFAVE